MTSKAIIAGIAVGVFFAGMGVSYTIFASTYDPATMKFRNQELFDQMMTNNPKMTSTWMDSMSNDPTMNQKMMMQMMGNEEFMKNMMQNPEVMNMMSNMMGQNMMDDSMMPNMQFNTGAPIVMPMINGYYNGERVYFIHTEVSDENMAQMMSKMVNFPTLYVPELKNISDDELGKVYVFTNGVSGTGPYGGGPFMFQIDVFDSIPDQMRYSQFRVPYLITWNDDSTPRILTSEAEILEAESNGELTIQKTDNVVNAPMMVWKSNGNIANSFCSHNFAGICNTALFCNKGKDKQTDSAIQHHASLGTGYLWNTCHCRIGVGQQFCTDF